MKKKLDQYLCQINLNNSLPHFIDRFVLYIYVRVGRLWEDGDWKIQFFVKNYNFVYSITYHVCIMEVKKPKILDYIYYSLNVFATPILFSLPMSDFQQ